MGQVLSCVRHFAVKLGDGAVFEFDADNVYFPGQAFEIGFNQSVRVRIKQVKFYIAVAVNRLPVREIIAVINGETGKFRPVLALVNGYTVGKVGDVFAADVFICV